MEEIRKAKSERDTLPQPFNTEGFKTLRAEEKRESRSPERSGRAQGSRIPAATRRQARALRLTLLPNRDLLVQKVTRLRSLSESDSNAGLTPMPSAPTS